MWAGASSVSTVGFVATLTDGSPAPPTGPHHSSVRQARWRLLFPTPLFVDRHGPQNRPEMKLRRKPPAAKAATTPIAIPRRPGPTPRRERPPHLPGNIPRENRRKSAPESSPGRSQKPFANPGGFWGVEGFAKPDCSSTTEPSPRAELSSPQSATRPITPSPPGIMLFFLLSPPAATIT